MSIMTTIFADFQEARGYKIERENYVRDLMSQNNQQQQQQQQPQQQLCYNWREAPRLSPEHHLRHFYNNRRIRNNCQHQNTSSRSNYTRHHHYNYYFSNRNSDRHTNRERSYTRRNDL